MKKSIIILGIFVMIAALGCRIEIKRSFHRHLSMAVSSISVSDFNNWNIVANNAYSWRDPIPYYRFLRITEDDSIISEFETYYKLNKEKFCRDEFVLVDNQSISNIQLEYVRFLADEIEAFRKNANIDLVWQINCFHKQIQIGFWYKGNQFILTNNRESIVKKSNHDPCQLINNDWFLFCVD